MRVVVHASPSIEWQGRFAKHIQSGLQQHGHTVSIISAVKPAHCDVSIIMGPNMYQQIEQNGQPYLMLNRKLIGNDPSTAHDTVALSWNGFNGAGTFCVNEIDPTRLERYIKVDEIEDWKIGGEVVIIPEQSNTGRSRQFKNMRKFYEYVKTTYPGPVKIRKKPIGENNIQAPQVRKGLIGAKAVANLNSTISIEALVAGVPVVSFDENDPAYAITGRDLNNLVYPDNRLEFFQYLAHCQWDEQEIINGKFWEQLWPIQGPKLNEWSNDGSTG
jgi:hypothetical protein